MAQLTYLNSQYIIKGTLSIAENALGRPDLVSVTIGGSTRITVDPELVGYAGDNNAKSWKVTGKNFQLEKAELYHIYIKCQRNTQDAAIFLSTFRYDLEGYIVDAGGNRIPMTETVKDEQGNDITIDTNTGDAANLYIRIGYVSVPVADKRTAYIDMGRYGTDSGQNDSIIAAVGDAIKAAMDSIRDFMRSSFLSKEHDDETPYGLTMKSLVVAEDADVKGKLIAKEADMGTAKAGTMTATQYIESPDVHTKGFKAITDTEGNGAKMWNDADGDGHVITDYMAVRKAAWFRSITIDEVDHAGGEIVLSAAACNLSRVKGIGDGGYLLFDTALGEAEGEDKPNFYRCYFEKEANGKTAYNEWKLGDQALCQKFDPKVGTSENVKNQYYWRVVIGLGEEDPDNNEDENENENNKLYYIDLSNDQGILDWDVLAGVGTSALYEPGKGCDMGCTAPAPNDAVVLKGSRSKADLYRRTCQVYSTVGDNAPSRIYYQDIHSFNLSEAKAVERLEWDDAKKHAHWRIGTEDKGYVDFSKDGLRIKASSIVMSGTGKDLGEIVGDEIEVYLLTDEEGIPTPRIDNDGTLVPNDDDNDDDNWVLAPFDWKADEYANHENAVVVTKEGLCYRWEMTDENWIWRQVTDEYLIEAFRRAETANEAFRSITEDGLIIPSEKIAIQKIYDEQVRRYMDDMETLTYLLVHRPMAKGSDEATEKYYDEVELLMTNYKSDHARLASCYLAILNSSEESIPVPENMQSYYDAYNLTDQKVRQFIQELSTFYFRQTDEMTELGNTFFTKGGDGKWGVLNNGLVTNKDWAKLFSNYTDENGDEKEAMVAVAVKDGLSSATIEADKINLSGHTMSFKGDEIEIDTEGFKLDKSGNAEYAGLVRSSLFYNTSNPIVWEAREPSAPEEGSYVEKDKDHHQYYQLNPLTDKTNGAIVGNYILPKAEDHFGLSYMFYNLDANKKTINRRTFGFLRTQEGDGIFDGQGGWFSEFKLHEYMFVRITSLKTGWLIEQATPASVLGAYTGTIIDNKPDKGPFAPWASNKA